MNVIFFERRFIAAMTVVWLLLLSMSASAQTTPHEVQNAPAAGQCGGSDGGKRTLIVTVFGEPLYLEQVTLADGETKRKELPPDQFDEWLSRYRGRRIYQIIWGEVHRRFREREQIHVTDEESAAIAQVMELRFQTEKQPPPGSAFTPEQQKNMMTTIASSSLIDWKVCKRLYEKYGGRVGLGSLGAWIAFDGQNALLREHYKAGDIKFHDRQIEKLFWQHMEIKNFADAYPAGENLKRLLATPPYLLNLPATPETASEISTRPQLHGGKSLDQWIAQAKRASEMKDRHNAMQVVRNFGLRTDRAKTLRVFTELLSDDAPTMRSLAAAAIRKAGRPTYPEALDKLVELLSQDISEIRLPPGVGEVGGEFGSLMRAVSALGTLGDTTRSPVLQRIAGNEKVDPLLCQAAKKAIQDIEAREEASDKERAAAIKKLEFLIGTWKYVAPENAPPNTSPQSRTITMQPDGLSLTKISESILGVGNPVHITWDVESQEYRVTHTDSNGEKRVFAAQLSDGNRLAIRLLEGKKGMFPDETLIMTVTGDTWTDAFEQPNGKEPFLLHTFERQPAER